MSKFHRVHGQFGQIVFACVLSVMLLGFTAFDLAQANSWSQPDQRPNHWHPHASRSWRRLVHEGKLSLPSRTVDAAAETAPAEAASAETPATSEAAPVAETHSEEPHWSYTGDTDPANWGQLSPDYTTCADGSAQSPIDIANPTVAALPDILFNYQAGAVDVFNNGHTVQVKFAADSSISSDDATYQLLQAHFHAPGEHTVDGRLYPAEWHFVHQADDGALAVIGVMVEEGEAAPAWDVLLSNMPAEEGTTMTLDSLDLPALLPADRLTVRYAGSLTTPPCSEGVQWRLLLAPLEMSSEQIGLMTARYEGNNRPVQPLNDREVVVDQSIDQ
jgi:carbonic anhydrase